MPLGSSSVHVTLLFGVIVLSLLQPGAVLVRAQRCTVSDGTIDLLAVEEECLEGEITFRAVDSSFSIPNGYSLEFVDFDVYCNTSEGVSLNVTSGGFDNYFRETTISLPAGSAVCRTTVCYRIEEEFGIDKLTYYLVGQPVCDYTVQCSALDNPLNGEVSLSDNTNVFSEASYSCNKSFVIHNVTMSRTCQIDGSWSGFQPTCVPENLELEVMLTADTLFPVVGSVVNLTCSGNGTPPLTIVFQDSLMETINQELITTPLLDNSAMIQRVLPWDVTEMGRLNFTCTVHNSTAGLGSSILQVTGVVRRYIQICFELPQDVSCDNFSSFSDVLPGFASELQANCSCIVPDSFELQTLPSTCNETCPQQLFYSMSVLVESEAELNTTLHEWLSLHDSITAAGFELVLNPACAPLLAMTVPSPICSPSVLTTSQTTTSTVSSEKPPSKQTPSETPTSSSTDSPDAEGLSNPVIVFIAVFVLVATFVLLTLTLVIMLFFFHKRRKHVSDFPVEGDITMYDDPIRQMNQGFEQQKQEAHSVNNKAVQKSMEVAQTHNSTSNGRIP